MLSNYLPEEAVSRISNYLQQYRCELHISKPRQTKLGDYRCPQKGKGHRISINSNLNPYAFLLTLVHEIAHMVVWEEHLNTTPPHGKEWKETFQRLMLPFLEIYPDNILRPLALHLKNPKASSSQDVTLTRALRQYDAKDYLTIADIKEGEQFQIENGRSFIKLKKLRKRYQCKALDNNRTYLFSPLAEITKG